MYVRFVTPLIPPASRVEAATALNAAHSRAGALLIVCGDPQRINSVLGAGV